MSEPQPKDRTTLYIAIVGAVATIAAALIGVLPSVFNRPAAPPPTPIVVTATPPPTLAAVATRPATSVPTTVVQATTAPPTTIPGSPTIPAPTVVEVISPTNAAPLPPPTRSNIITFLLLNNLPRTMEFFVDGQSATKINSGTYQALKVPRGQHELRQCVVGSDYGDPNNCFARTYDVQPNPDVWEMFDSNNPLRTDANINLLILNRANTAQDFFVDNQLVESIPATDFVMVTVSPGQHTVQPCAPGFSPPSSACGDPFRLNYFAPTHFFIINGESS